MKLLPKITIITTIISLLILAPTIAARTTPEDIVNAKKAEFEKRSANYSPLAKQKLQTFDKRIAELNKKQTDELEFIMIKQGLILEEYVRRNEVSVETTKLDRTKPVENARYWMTYAHEAVAYQAAKVYIVNLTSETNLNKDLLSTITSMQSDMNTLRNKVIKSQSIIEKLVAE